MLLNSDKWCCLGVSFEVYSASGGSLRLRPHVSDPLRFFLLFCLFAFKVRGRSFKTTSCLRCELQGSATSRHFKSGNLRVRSPQPYGSRKLQIGQIRPKSKEETRTQNFLKPRPAQLCGSDVQKFLSSTSALKIGPILADP